MAQLVNTQTNQIEEVGQDQLHEDLTSGKYNLVKGDSVNVINPSGQLVSLPAEQVPEALQSNFKFASQNDITQYENKQKYEQPLEQAKTFGEGVASGATFGASRELEKALFKNTEEQKLRSEINPGMELAGELTGGIGSMIVAPELAPVSMAAKVGRGVTGAAEAIGTKAASTLANPETSPIFAKLLKSAVTTGSKTLGSAVEGTAYGLGEAVKEHALGDADLNAENILHNVGYGALFGGALGATIGGIESGYKLVNPVVEKAALKDAIIENAAKPIYNPNEVIRNVADEYAATKGVTLDHTSRATPLSSETRSNIAKAYENMPHNPSDPEVQKAYSALINETEEQFNAIQKTGLKIESIKPDMKNPYTTSKDMMKDIQENNHLWFYPTEQGFGTNASRLDHPLLQPSKVVLDGKPLAANDVFRIVHDYFGHAKEMNQKAKKLHGPPINKCIHQKHNVP
jgi:hypothetical protein